MSTSRSETSVLPEIRVYYFTLYNIYTLYDALLHSNEITTRAMREI